MRRLKTNPHALLPTLNPDILRAHLARVARESNRQFNELLRAKHDSAYDDLPAELKHLVDDATARNIDLIRGLREDTRKRVRRALALGDSSQMTSSQLGSLLNKTAGLELDRAIRVARDQVLKLQGVVTRVRSEDLGIETYTWDTSNDSRVRPDHRRLNGKVFAWNDPPVVNLKTGRRAHPGGDFYCRCLALPNV